MSEFEIATIDIAILVTYVLGTRIVLGWWFARRARQGGAEDYFLAGRRMSWPIIGLSFYVANMSGSTFIALPGSGYHEGIAVYNYEWLPALLLVFFATFVLPLFLRERIYTAPEYLERRFGPPARTGFSIFLLLANIFIDAAAALYASAVVMQALFPAIPLWLTIAVAALVAGVYIFFGGLGAVVLNDAIQATLIIVGGGLLAWLTFEEVGSWAAVRAATTDEALHLIRPADDPVMPWPGLLTGVLIIGFYFWCTNQFVIQRALGARSLADGRRGALFAGLLKLPNLFLLILPGVMATALYPDLENPDTVFPKLAFDLLPVGLRGLMLAALAAAIFSSLEAILNSAATLFTMDLARAVKPGMGDRALVWTGRLATLGFMALAAIWAPADRELPDALAIPAVDPVLRYATRGDRVPAWALLAAGQSRRGNGDVRRWHPDRSARLDGERDPRLALDPVSLCQRRAVRGQCAAVRRRKPGHGATRRGAGAPRDLVSGRRTHVGRGGDTAGLVSQRSLPVARPDRTRRDHGVLVVMTVGRSTV